MVGVAMVIKFALAGTTVTVVDEADAPELAV